MVLQYDKNNSIVFQYYYIIKLWSHDTIMSGGAGLAQGLAWGLAGCLTEGLHTTGLVACTGHPQRVGEGGGRGGEGGGIVLIETETYLDTGSSIW